MAIEFESEVCTESVYAQPQDACEESDSDAQECSIYDEVYASNNECTKDNSADPVISQYLDAQLGNLYPQAKQAAPLSAEINQDIAPIAYKIKPGDNLTNIAKSQLGPDANDLQVKQHIARIAETNNLKNKNSIVVDRELLLPGYTKDGGIVDLLSDGSKVTAWKSGAFQIDETNGNSVLFRTDGTESYKGLNPQDNYEMTANGGKVVVDATGKRTSQWPDGTRKEEFPDGRGYINTPGQGADGLPDGTYEIQNWGPKAKDNFTIAKLADGRFERTDKTEAQDHSELPLERLRLDQKAQANLSPAEYTNFKDYMKYFENRVVQNNNLTDESAAKTYHQIGRIFDADGDAANSALSQAERNRVAQELLENAINPKAVDQGYHSTCNVATIETRFLTNNPELVAGVTADIAIKGKYESPRGLNVEVAPINLRPDAEAARLPLLDGQRNYASQLFQTAAINLDYASQGKGIRYEQHAQNPLLLNDTGERTVDYTGAEPKTVREDNGFIQRALGIDEIKWGGLSVESMINISNEISGKDEKDFILESNDERSKNALKVGSEFDLMNKLYLAKQEGKFPMIAFVDAVNEPFLSDAADGTISELYSPHVVTIVDYDPITGKVEIDNQWGSFKDHLGSNALSVRELYMGIELPRSTEVLETWRKDVEDTRASGKLDGFKELHLLHLERQAKELDDEEFDTALITQMLINKVRWNIDGHAGTLDQDEQNRTNKKYQQLLKMIDGQDEERAKAIRNALK